ncbi:MAG TPA: hypothetical protein VII94_00355 [Candidatus Saccharimonadales bacterium]
MKLSMLFGAALVLFSSAAFAHDDTYIGNVSAHGETTVVRKIPKGHHSVEVFTEGGGFDGGAGRVTTHVYNAANVVNYTCENTSHCTHVLDTDIDIEANFTIISSSDKSFGFRVWIH